jgi:hypothetical protein
MNLLFRFNCDEAHNFSFIIHKKTNKLFTVIRKLDIRQIEDKINICLI